MQKLQPQRHKQEDASGLSDLAVEGIHGVDGVLPLGEMDEGVIPDLLHSLHRTCRRKPHINRMLAVFQRRHKSQVPARKNALETFDSVSGPLKEQILL